jgi:hypothetical protein
VLSADADEKHSVLGGHPTKQFVEHLRLCQVTAPEVSLYHTVYPDYVVVPSFHVSVSILR